MTMTTAPRSEPPTADRLETLRRWARFGGTWQVVGRSGAVTTVALRRCDGGEEVERFTSADPAVLAWLADNP